MQVSWTRSAIADLGRIRAYIGQFNPYAAEKMSERLFDAGNSLADFPERGRPAGRADRELVSVWPYVIRYRIVGRTILVLRVRHGMRRPPRA